jgi:hypothetical protein
MNKYFKWSFMETKQTNPKHAHKSPCQYNRPMRYWKRCRNRGDVYILET